MFVSNELSNCMIDTKDNIEMMWIKWENSYIKRIIHLLVGQG